MKTREWNLPVWALPAAAFCEQERQPIGSERQDYRGRLQLPSRGRRLLCQVPGRHA